MNYIDGVKLHRIPEDTSYLSKLPLVRFLEKIDTLSFKKPVIFFVGDNGTGKSTLIEAIAAGMGFGAAGGSREHTLADTDAVSALSEYLSVIRAASPKDGFFLRAESFYPIAGYLDENGTRMRNQGIVFREKSHGESFISLIQNRFYGNGLYILDEPEAALSPQKLLTLITLIDDLVKKDSQFIIATHSPLLMAYPDAEILQFADDGVHRTAYRDTEHYQITKMFMDDPERMLHYLLHDDRT